MKMLVCENRAFEIDKISTFCIIKKDCECKNFLSVQIEGQNYYLNFGVKSQEQFDNLVEIKNKNELGIMQ